VTDSAEGCSLGSIITRESEKDREEKKSVIQKLSCNIWIFEIHHSNESTFNTPYRAYTIKQIHPMLVTLCVIPGLLDTKLIS